MKIPLYQVDAFAERPFQGNPAAVCPLTKWLPDSILQAIAEENNLAETAFFVGSDGVYKLRWFTPTAEVDLCGHATLATAQVLFTSTCADRAEITFESRSGSLQVTREDDLLTLDFPVQTSVRCDPPETLVKGLGSRPVECYRAMDYMAVFNDEDCVATLSPDFQRLMSLDLRGVIVTARGNTEDFVSRFFAPNFGINEDPVTGSAHCMLTPYWAAKLDKNKLTAMQISKRTGRLVCQLDGDRVLISGRAVPYMEGLIQLECERDSADQLPDRGLLKSE